MPRALLGDGDVRGDEAEGLGFSPDADGHLGRNPIATSEKTATDYDHL